MGCLKLSYYEGGSALAREHVFSLKGGEKSVSGNKKSIDYYPFGMLMPGRSGYTTNYPFSYNGKERVDEINSVTGANYDYGARIYDARTGRWLSIDPKYYKYPSLSSYCAFGNSPMIITDPGGETLKVVTINPENIGGFQTMVSRAFSDKVIAEIDENSTVTFHQVAGTTLTEYQTAALYELNKVTSSTYTATFNLVSNDKNVHTADYHTGTIDIADIQSFGNDANAGQTSMSVIVHEAVEQLEKNNWEVLLHNKLTLNYPSNSEDRDYYFNQCHGKAIEAENKTASFERSTEAEVNSSKTTTSGWASDKNPVDKAETIYLKRTNPEALQQKATLNTTYDANGNNPKSTITK